MIKRKNGYSLGVLVITIAVMIILTTTALISFRSMSGDKVITNFMNDIQEVEEYVKEYYATKHVLPLLYSDGVPLGITADDFEEMRSQADENDFGSYYFVDIDKLERIHLVDEDRQYIVNTNTLKVYVLESVIYQNVEYYTVTDEMRGYDKTYNNNADFEIIISGNPIAWSTKAKLILSVPSLTLNQDVSNPIMAEGWTFKYDENGPITADEFRNRGSLFMYGETIEISRNGIVTFYAEDPNGYAKVVNVVITKIDDISPTITVSGDRAINGAVVILDNETGINPDTLKYKIIGKDDLTDFEDGRTLLSYGINYAKYIEEYNTLTSRYDDIETEINDLKALGSGDDELADLNTELSNTQADINLLNAEYPDFNNNGIPYSDEETNIALYAEDYAGNSVIYRDGVSRSVLLNSSLIDYEAELLDNSAFSVVKTMPYISGDKVNLRIRSQGATHMLITTDPTVSPKDISNYVPYESSNGTYEFDLGTAVGPEITIYAYYTAGEYENGELIYEALSDTVNVDRINPSKDAPEIKISNDLELEIKIMQKDNESGIFKTEYGYQKVDLSEDVMLYTWVDTVDELEQILEAGKSYYVRTRVIDAAGNGPVVSDYTILQCPIQKIVTAPNEPKIQNLNMKAITWKNNLEEVEIDPKTLLDSDGVTRVWYDYELGNGIDDTKTSKWANAKTDDGSYWVWIPRYAYRIIYYTNSSKTEIKGYYQNSAYANTIGYYLADGRTAARESEVKTLYGEIDIVFLYNTENDKYYDPETKLVKSLIEGGEKGYSEYIVHPAFKAYSAATTVNKLGNWNRELTGIWVAKYEASRTDATFTDIGSENTIKVVPNVKSINNVTINEAYSYALQMNTGLNSHLMKNSEWGAVAYLAYSAYGRNGHEVEQNLASNMITGAGTTSNGATYATTSESIFDSRYGYKTSAGLQASTTGNIYGVYDLVGGGEEYVSAYINNGETVLSTNGHLLQDTSTIYLSQSYSEGTSDTANGNYTINSGVYGDAIYELSSNSSSIWGNYNLTYPAGGEPFFIRGGSYDSEYGSTGIFDVNRGAGTASEEISFRPVLAP